MRLYRIEYIETPYQLTKLLPTYHKVDEDYMATFTQDDYQELLDDGYFYYRDGFEIVFDIDNDIDYTAMKSIIYNDYTKLNQRLIDDYMLDLYFFCNEMELPKSKITEIPMDKLQIIIDKMGLIIQNVKTAKPVIMNEDEIIDFIEHISNVIIDDLNQYGLIKEKQWKKD